MNKIYNSFLITTLAGFTTLLGIIPCLLKNKNNIVIFSLSLSSGVMFCISIFSLIPESKIYLNNNILLILYIILGFIFALSIDKILDLKVNNNTLFKIGLVSTIALIIHNIPEGIMTFISFNENTKLGIKLAIAIALHNIPEGIAISIPIFYSTKNISKAFKYTFIAGFSELLGAIISYIFLINIITKTYLGFILAITSGIMLEISILELLPESFKYKKNKLSITSFVLGFIIMFICNIIF